MLSFSFSLLANDGFYSIAGNELTAGETMASLYIKRALRKNEDGDKEGALADLAYARQLDSDLAAKYEHEIMPRRTAEQWYKRAKNTLFVNEKINCYEKAVEYDPAFIKAWEKLAKLYKKQKRYEDAVNAYKTLISLNPKKQSYVKKLNKIIASDDYSAN